ncbi:MAG TPA: hypothetical protein VJ790_03380 [Dongiaceae bacterium]|nr:hypothetical protein [Dongiaceae bacterium]
MSLLRGKADDIGAVSGCYEFKGNAICYYYPGLVRAHQLIGDAIRFLEDGKLVSNEFNTRWLQGNPHNL